jgi:hypothetical protein
LSSELGVAERARQKWTLPSSPPQHPRSLAENSRAN